jgi:23S rRNA (cytosine1962-C5)-methyltransferase
MFSKNQYALLDFGDGRRLERFGDYVLDRLCPAAEGIQRVNPGLWKSAHARYSKRGEDGNWHSRNAMPLSWTICHGTSKLELKLTDFGHVGVFPEHAGNWDWISQQVKKSNGPMRVLNLFAYTGGGTLAAASAGAEVVHVDSAQNSVLWARRNTEASGLSNASIRWITEDALKFVARELKRGNKYQAVLLDPPSYGHGPKGEVWKIQDSLPELLDKCMELTAQDRRFLLLSCHTTGYLPADLERILRNAVGDRHGGTMQAGGLAIRAADGRQLPSGIAVRWTAKGS